MHIGLFIIVISSLLILTSVPSLINAFNEGDLAYALGRFLGGNFLSIFGLVVGILVFKVGKSDRELAEDNMEQSFTDITGKN